MRYPILFHEADTDAEPQSGSSGKVRASDVLEQFGRDAIRLAEKLADVQSDNYRLRNERRDLKQQLTEAQGKAPAADARLLTADEAKAYDAYAALGTPDALKQAIDANGATSAESNPNCESSNRGIASWWKMLPTVFSLPTRKGRSST